MVEIEEVGERDDVCPGLVVVEESSREVDDGVSEVVWTEESVDMGNVVWDVIILITDAVADVAVVAVVAVVAIVDGVCGSVVAWAVIGSGRVGEGVTDASVASDT